jgi:hypothetical protein
MQSSGLAIDIFLFLLFGFYASVQSEYILKENYPLDIFFDKFDFFSCGVPSQPCDPTNGYVQYVEHASAQLAGLISTTSKSVIIRADNTTVLDPKVAAPGRKSVRIESKSAYNHAVRTPGVQSLVMFQTDNETVGYRRYQTYAR